MAKNTHTPTIRQLRLENEELRARAAEAEETLYAIRHGAVDAIIVSDPDGGDRIFSLMSAETPYRLLLEAMSEGAATLAADGTLLYVNRRVAELFALPPEQIIGKHLTRLIADVDPPQCAAWLQAGQRGQFRAETCVTVPEQSPRYLQLTFSPLPPAVPGDICLMIADITALKQTELELRQAHDTLEQKVNERTANLVAEITARKQAEAHLRESEERFAKIFNASPIGINIFRLADRRAVDANPAYLDLIGYTREEVIGHTAAELNLVAHPEERPKWFTTLEEHKSLRTQETQLRRKNGDIRQVFAAVDAIELHGEAMGLTVIVDLTDLRRTEAELQTSLTKYRVLFETLPLGITIADVQGQILESNPEADRLLGLSPEAQRQRQIDGQEWQIIRTDGTPLPAAEFPSVRALQEQRVVANVEMGLVQGAHAITWINVTAAPLPIAGYGVVVAYNDITDRKQAEKALKTSEQKLGTLFEILPVGVSILNAEHQVVYMNSRLEQILGMNRAGLLRGDYAARQYLRADGTPMPLAEFASSRAMQEQQAVYGVETGVLKEDGTLTWTSVSAVPVDFPDWRVVVVTTDITERKRAAAELERTRNTLVEAQKIAHLGSFEYVAATRTTVWSEEEYRIYGLDPTGPSPAYDVMLATCFPPDDAALLHATFTQAIANSSIYELEHRVVRPDGSVRWVYDRAYPYFDEHHNLLRYVGVTLDITDRKQAEIKLREQTEMLQLAYAAADLGIWKNDLRTGAIYFDERARRHYGFDTSETTLAEVLARVHPDDVAQLGQEIGAATGPGGSGRFATEYRVTHPDGSVHWLAIQVRVSFEGEGAARHSTIGVGTSQDITARKQAEEILRQRTEELEELLDLLPTAVWIAKDPKCHDIRGNRYANALFDVSADINVSQTAEGGPAVRIRNFIGERELHGDELPMQAAALTGQPQTGIELQIERPDGVMRALIGGAVPLLNSAGQPRGAVAAFLDITERKQAEDQLRATMEELRRSNAELEQFAYVASHDLQEPLRALAGMVQLLQQRYQDKVDARGQEFIRHAMEAALRMQTLINDLLAFSRVGTRGKPFAPTDVEHLLKALFLSLSVAIRESGAVITHDPLPTVIADELQLMQLLQNLISNAIKFRGEQPPQIHLSAERSPEGWRFAVRDSGIGIEPQYFERIFVVFQRLHTRREYPGTGIGLALCKKIVERHGGRIWVESQPGQGSTFYFTLPA